MSDQEKQEQTSQDEQKPGQPDYDEKTEEKYEKEDEKSEEKHDRDPLSNLTWALILIWAGLVFLGKNIGLLDTIAAQTIQIGEITINQVSTWSMIFLGAGLLLFVEGLIRTFVPSYRSSTGGNFFLAAIFVGIGLGALIGYSLVWPFVLIAMGLAALASALVRNRK